VRKFAVLSSVLGLLLCLATAGTGIWWGVKKEPALLLEVHLKIAVGCVAAACGAGCEPTALPLEQAHKFTLRYAVPFFLRYVRGRDLFPRALRPRDAPDGVVVLEAHAHGEGPRR